MYSLLAAQYLSLEAIYAYNNVASEQLTCSIMQLYYACRLVNMNNELVIKKEGSLFACHRYEKYNIVCMGSYKLYTARTLLPGKCHVQTLQF